MFVKFSRPPKPGLSRFQATKATLSSFSGHQSHIVKFFRPPKHVCQLFQVTKYRSHVCQVRETDGKVYRPPKPHLSSFSGHQSHVCHLFQVTKYRSHVCQVRETDGKAGSALSANSMCAFAVFTVYFFSFMKTKKQM